MNELKILLGGSTDLDEKELGIILKEADLNNDGNIDFDDFYRMMHNLEGSQELLK